MHDILKIGWYTYTLRLLVYLASGIVCDAYVFPTVPLMSDYGKVVFPEPLIQCRKRKITLPYGKKQIHSQLIQCYYITTVVEQILPMYKAIDVMKTRTKTALAEEKWTSISVKKPSRKKCLYPRPSSVQFQVVGSSLQKLDSRSISR